MAREPMSSILVTIRITVQIQESEVRNPHSLDYRKSYQRILMKFYGELGCGLETNWLHFGDDPYHYIRIRESVPDHDPDPATCGKNCHVVNTHRTDALSAAPMSSILVTIWITVRIQESEVRNPDSLDYPLRWRSAEVCAIWVLLGLLVILNISTIEQHTFIRPIYAQILQVNEYNGEILVINITKYILYIVILWNYTHEYLNLPSANSCQHKLHRQLQFLRWLSRPARSKHNHARN